MIALADTEVLGGGGEGVQHSLQRLNDDHKHKHAFHLPYSRRSQLIPDEMIWIPSPPPYPAYAPKQCLPCPLPSLSHLIHAIPSSLVRSDDRNGIALSIVPRQNTSFSIKALTPDFAAKNRFCVRRMLIRGCGYGARRDVRSVN
jgi:hypothetical protein